MPAERIQCTVSGYSLYQREFSAQSLVTVCVRGRSLVPDERIQCTVSAYSMCHRRKGVQCTVSGYSLYKRESSAQSLFTVCAREGREFSTQSLVTVHQNFSRCPEAFSFPNSKPPCPEATQMV